MSETIEADDATWVAPARKLMPRVWPAAFASPLSKHSTRFLQKVVVLMMMMHKLLGLLLLGVTILSVRPFLPQPTTFLFRGVVPVRKREPSGTLFDARRWIIPAT